MSSGRENSRDPCLRWLAVGNLVVLVAGGILGYWFVQRPLVEVQTELAKVRIRGEAIEVERKASPRLAVMPTLNDNHIGWDIREGTLEILLENIGEVPITIGSVRLEVFSSVPGGQIKELLMPQARDFEEYYPEVTPVPPDEESRIGPSPPPTFSQRGPGELHTVSSEDISWTPVKGMDRTVQTDVKIGPGEKRLQKFDYLLRESPEPLWYKFKVTVSPPAYEKWNDYKVDQRIPGHHAPPWGGSTVVARPVVEQSYKTSKAYPGIHIKPVAPPIPIKKRDK